MAAFPIALALALVFIVVPTPAAAVEVAVEDSPAEVALVTDCALAAEPAAVVADEASYRGCCSWHSGVCGCYGIRVVCCDGSLSPSCLCHDTKPGEVLSMRMEE